MYLKSKTSLVEFLQDAAQNLDLIQKEMKDKTTSPTLLDMIHEYDEEHKHTLNCKRSARACLIALIEAYVTLQNYKDVVTLAEVIMRALTSENVNMKSQYLSKLNNVFRDKFGKLSEPHLFAKGVLKLQNEEKAFKTTQDQDKRLQKNLNPHEILDVTIYRIINAGLETKASWKDKFISIALACGSRLIEIACDAVSRFSESKESPGQLNQKGIAKDQDAATQGQRSVDKPVIGMTVERLLLLIQEGRDLLKAYALQPNILRVLNLKNGDFISGQDKQDVTHTIDHALNVRVRQLFGEKCHFHSLRAVYGNFSFQLYGNVHCGISLNAWLSRVLGHKPGSLSTALSYTTVIVSKKLNDVKVDFKDAICEFQGKLNDFEKRLDTSTSVGQIQQALQDSLVKVENSEGKHIETQKQPRLKDGKQGDRLEVSAQELEKQNVHLTYRNLLSLGYGSAAVRAFFFKRKR